MKIIKWIGHPVIVMVLYLLLIIEGNEFGGFYMLYLILSLPHLVPYALIAAAGLFFMMLAFNYKGPKVVAAIFYLLGYSLMVVSLINFFSKGNKWKTFEPGIPLYSFIVFGISSFCFLVWVLSLLSSSHKKTIGVLH